MRGADLFLSPGVREEGGLSVHCCLARVALSVSAIGVSVGQTAAEHLQLAGHSLEVEGREMGGR